VIFAVALLVFVIGLSRLEILMIDTRFALFVHEMGENGIYPFPQLYGKLYPDYTSIPVILMYWSSLLFGGIDWFTIALPSAICMAFIVMFTYKIGSRMYSPAHGLVAAILMFGAWEILNIGRIVSLDAYPALAAVIGFYLIYMVGRAPRLLHLWLWWLPVLMIMGFLGRGPIGVVVPTAVFISYYLVAGRFRMVLVIGFAGAAILAGMLALWAWFAHYYGGGTFYAEFWEMQITGRLGSTKPLWYYFTNGLGSFAVTYPLALLVLLVYIRYWKRDFFRIRQNPRLAKVQWLAAWMLIVILGMSIPGTKHLRYITAAMPPAALLAGLLILNPDHLKLLTWLRHWVIRIAMLVPFVALAGLWIAVAVLRLPPVVEALDGVEIKLPLFVPSVILGLFCLAVVAARRKVRRIGKHLLVITLLVATMVLARIMIIETIAEARMSSTEFVAKVEALRPEGQPLHFIFLGPDGDENKYMLHVNRERIFVPQYLNWPDERLKTLPVGTLVVSRKDRYFKYVDQATRDRMVILAEGRIARRDCLFLRVTGDGEK
jgi:4-amino-4-deoxy-L-arabinose transferase-like glycosyltransferase